ncbi:MAG: 23S rRNA pseudouridine(1911/1915/1917) synthase RluD [Gammaproteobacteria bacterium]|nr:23S rRNA pseudouridine(1911/1915/1917) synthase RluD [Gammaproteobacteria bacterium]
MVAEHFDLSAVIPESLSGGRVDAVLAQLFPQFSRARLQHWIKDGQVRVNGRCLRPRDRVMAGESVVLQATVAEQSPWQAEQRALDVVYEDAALLVINKPAGLVVHPAAGNWQGTLLNAVLAHDPALAALPRGGIVHRLDKDTSGLMVVARTLAAHTSLVQQLQARSVRREYLALVYGALTGGATVDQPIGRHPQQRTRMAVVEGGKPAVTHVRIEERFAAHTLVRARLETGRTHQIRVHLSWLRHPLVGDPLYGGRLQLPRGCAPALAAALQQFQRQALHATRLSLLHPVSGDEMDWVAALPADMQALIAALRGSPA